MSHFLLCLSSGMTPQYRLDILRLLALPQGSHIQFRYGHEIIAENLREALQWNMRVNERAILAHVDGNEAARTSGGICPITPCRHAVLLESKMLGSFYFLQFRLEEFALWNNVWEFQQQIEGDLPHWTAKDKIIGRWCVQQSFQVGADHKVEGTTAWQAVIKQLATSQDFAKESFFFAVEGIRSRGKTTAIAPVNGEFRLTSERDYVARVFHFHPDGDYHRMNSVVGSIKIEVSTPHLESVTSPLLPVSSPYDLRDFYFRVNPTVGTRFGSLVLRVIDNVGEAINSQPELFVPIRLKSTWIRTGLFAFLIAGLLFAQQYVSAMAKGPVSLSISLALLVLALGTAIVAVFGIKKPV